MFVFLSEKKNSRTHAGQFEIYVAHLEQHELLRTGGQGDPKTFNGLWENLTVELNSYGVGPRKSAREWQNTFNQWKHQIRHEARKLKKNSMETGGGPASALLLTDIKERALNLLGRVVVDGHNIGRVGRGVCTPKVTFAAEDDDESAIEYEVLDDVADDVPRHVTDSANQNDANSNTKRSNTKTTFYHKAKDTIATLGEGSSNRGYPKKRRYDCGGNFTAGGPNRRSRRRPGSKPIALRATDRESGAHIDDAA